MVKMSHDTMSLRTWEGGTGEKEPKQRVSCVVWAIGKLFFCSIRVFTLLTMYLCFFQVLPMSLRTREGGTGEKEHKRRVSHVVWAIGKLFFLF